MSTQENLNFTKHTIWSFLGVNILTKTETYSEVSAEGEPFKIIVNQDYFNKEFDIGKKQGDDKTA